MDIKNIFNVGYQGFPDGSVHFFNTRIIELTGYENVQFNNKSLNWIRDLMYPEDVPEATDAIRAALKGDKTYSRSYRIRTKAGAEKWILELSQIMCNDQGKMDCVTGTLIDITEEKFREREEARIRQLTGKYLLVSLQDEQYGIPIMKIREIIRMVQVTTVPNAPRFVRGLINLRGNTIPIVDLGLKLNIGSSCDTSRACIVVVEIVCEADIITVGIVVDSVSEVVNIHGSEIEETIGSVITADNGYLLGIAKIKEMPHVLLNMDRLFSPDELLSIERKQLEW